MIELFNNQEVKNLINLWIEAFSYGNLIYFKRYNTCEKYLKVRDKIAKVGDHDRVYYGTEIEDMH
jgi:hypothetical protein